MPSPVALVHHDSDGVPVKTTIHANYGAVLEHVCAGDMIYVLSPEGGKFRVLKHYDPPLLREDGFGVVSEISAYEEGKWLIPELVMEEPVKVA